MGSRRSIDDYVRLKDHVQGRCYAEILQVESEFEQLKFLMSEEYHMKVAERLEFIGLQQRQLQADLFASYHELRVILLVLSNEVHVLKQLSIERKEECKWGFSWKRLFGSSRVFPKDEA